jgi:hypothetical protein
MGAYYVSAEFGLDTNDGLTPGADWATLAKANSELAAYNAINGDQGHTVYIGPGTYREMIELGASGLDADHCIEWVGDAINFYGLASVAGIVRVTRCDADELPQAGTVVSFNAKNYVKFRNLYIDGSADGYGVSGTDRTKMFVDSCYITSKSGVQNVTITNSVILAGFIALRVVFADNCIMSGGNTGVYDVSTVKNSITIGGTIGYQASGVQTLVNCVAIGHDRGFMGADSTMQISNCMTAFCNTGFYGTSTTSKLQLATSYALSNNNNTRGSGTYDTNDLQTGKAVLFDQTALIRAMMPIMGAGLKDLGTAAGAPLTDIEGRTIVGIPSIGPHFIPATTKSAAAGAYRFTPPGLVIPYASEELIRFDVPEGAFRVYLQVKVVDATNYGAKIKLTGDVLSGDVEITSNPSGDWESLSIAGVAAVDGEVTLRLIAQELGSTAYFSDIKCTAEHQARIRGSRATNIPMVRLI